MRYTARPMNSRGMIEALRDAGVAYVLLTIAGGVDQLRRFARDIMPTFTLDASRACGRMTCLWHG